MNTSASFKKSPLKFFLLVYALSIPLWVLGNFVNVEGLPLDIPVTDLVATFTPLVAASILIYREEGSSGVRRLLKRAFDYARIKQKIWYLPTIFLMPLIYFLIYAVMRLMELPLPSEIRIPFMTIPILFVAFFIAAAGEELGYTGYAIDPMQDRWGALKAGIILGSVWAVWHYPSIIQQGHTATWIAWGTLGTVGLRVLIVWLYNNTGRSVFAAILFHTMANVGRTSFPVDQTHNPLVDYPYVHYTIIAIAAAIVAFLWGQKTLSRFRYSILDHRNP